MFRIEGRTIKSYWTLLCSDILLFAKVSRDRVLFVMDEPISLANVMQSCFNVKNRGKSSFRIVHLYQMLYNCDLIYSCSYRISHNYRSEWQISGQSDHQLHTGSNSLTAWRTSQIYIGVAHTITRIEGRLAKFIATTNVNIQALQHTKNKNKKFPVHFQF